MTIAIPREAEYIVVEFAVPGSADVHKQRVTVTWKMRDTGDSGIASVIAAAVKACCRKRISIANALRVTHKGAVLFEAAGTLPGGFRS
jgi:hypothetical protein